MPRPDAASMDVPDGVMRRDKIESRTVRSEAGPGVFDALHDLLVKFDADRNPL